MSGFKTFASLQNAKPKKSKEWLEPKTRHRKIKQAVVSLKTVLTSRNGKNLKRRDCIASN